MCLNEWQAIGDKAPSVDAPCTGDPVVPADVPRSAYDVVIVTHNSHDLVADCLASVGRFFGEKAFRLYVMDNASRDDSVSIVSALEPEATVIANERNVGFAVAVNQAIRLSTADVVVLVNPDVHDIKGDPATVSRILEQDPRAAAVATRMSDESGVAQRNSHKELSPFAMISENLALHERLPRWNRARAYRMLDWDMSDGRAVEDACAGFLFLRREALQDVGPFDERFFLYCEETDWMLRARRQGWEIVYTPEIEAVHSGAGSSDEDGETMSRFLLESQYAYLRKHFGFLLEASTRGALAMADVARAGRGLVPGQGAERRVKARAALGRIPLHCNPFAGRAASVRRSSRARARRARAGIDQLELGHEEMTERTLWGPR